MEFDAICLTAPLWVSAAIRPSDGDIKFWVKDAIAEDPHINTSGVMVAVVDGIVSLSGEGPDLAAKNYAVLEAKKVKGVLGVINNLTMARSTMRNSENVLCWSQYRSMTTQ